jgi:hypothetical protein
MHLNNCAYTYNWCRVSSLLSRLPFKLYNLATSRESYITSLEIDLAFPRSQASRELHTHPWKLPSWLSHRKIGKSPSHKTYTYICKQSSCCTWNAIKSSTFVRDFRPMEFVLQTFLSKRMFFSVGRKKPTLGTRFWHYFQYIYPWSYYWF